MSEAKKAMMGFMPPMPGWGWYGSKKDQKEQWEDFKSTMKTFWEQMQEMQKTSKDNWQEQWNKVFPQFLDMQDNFASFLPEELPSMPGMPAWPMTPKEFMDKVKEFQEMTNKHAMEQADSFFDFCMDTQEQTRSMVSDTVKNIEENLD